MSDAPQDHDDVRKIVKDNDIEFLFAQFVDMHGKPSAKLVPAHHIDDLLTEGAGFAGFAAGDIGQGPDSPDMIGLFQRVARRVGDQLGRPVVSVANGREITITFGREEDPGLAGAAARVLPE